jgi:prepilin-type N-terminal cleavage/methylation domain-containing protein
MPQRRGFTLVEVLVALVIMGIVTGAIYQLLNTSQRLSLAQAEQASLQSNVRTGSLVVPNELRELNTWLGGLDDRNDVLDPLDDDAITYRAMRGLGFVCQVPAADELTIAKSSWTGLRPPAGDRDDVYLFIDGNEDDDDDDQWLPVDITGATEEANACDDGATGFVLTTAAALPAEALAVKVYTPLRLYEVMELKLHGADGEWWLGARSVNVEPDPQPVLGPLTAEGFNLVYLDAVGAETADRTAIKSIQVTVRGLTEDAVRAGGSGALGHPEEELLTQVLLRNSIRP